MYRTMHYRTTPYRTVQYRAASYHTNLYTCAPPFTNMHMTGFVALPPPPPPGLLPLTCPFLSTSCCTALYCTILACVPQALLEGISLSQPQPKIPPELIKFLGKSFNAWHIAIPLLESHVIIFPDEGRCFDALAELYKQVGITHLAFQLREYDRMCGVWQRRA